MLATDLQPGGLPMRLVRLADRLRDCDVEPVVGCLASRGPLSDELAAAGIETFCCEARGRFDLGCLAGLARHVRRVDPDVVHASLFHANVAARLVGRLDRCRPIVTSIVTIEIERTWHRWLESLTGGWSDVHVANSAAVARHLSDELGFPPERVVVVRNAVAFEEIDGALPVDRIGHGLRADVPLIVWAGRMDPVKNLPTFVEAVEYVRRRLPVQAVLLGDGSERAPVAKMICERGLQSDITLAPWSGEVAAWLKAADCLLFPSFTEGSPNVVIEAMAAGCAVVASDIPACRELIEDGVDGYLCGARDVAAFAGAVELMCVDHQARAAVTARARQRAEANHNMKTIVLAWRRVYERALSA